MPQVRVEVCPFRETNGADQQLKWIFSFTSLTQGFYEGWGQSHPSEEMKDTEKRGQLHKILRKAMSESEPGFSESQRNAFSVKAFLCPIQASMGRHWHTRQSRIHCSHRTLPFTSSVQESSSLHHLLNPRAPAPSDNIAVARLFFSDSRSSSINIWET